MCVSVSEGLQMEISLESYYLVESPFFFLRLMLLYMVTVQIK